MIPQTSWCGCFFGLSYFILTSLLLSRMGVSAACTGAYVCGVAVRVLMASEVAHTHGGWSSAMSLGLKFADGEIC